MVNISDEAVDVPVIEQILTISSPVDSILPPKKLAKGESGFAVPICEPMLGSSPVLHHKDARDGQHGVEEVLSQKGSSVSPHHSGVLLTQQGSLMSFSDCGSSNAFRPDTITDSLMEDSETTKKN